MAINWKLENGKTLEDCGVTGQDCFEACMVLNAVGISKITSDTIHVILGRWVTLRAMSNPLDDAGRKYVFEKLFALNSLSINVMDETASQFLKRIDRRSLDLPKGYKTWQGTTVR